MPIGLDNIRRTVRELDLGGRPICLHSSLRGIGLVEGGPATVIDAFLAEGCTLLVPTFSSVFAAAPPAGVLPVRNGWPPAVSAPPETSARCYTPDCVDINRTMGAIPATLLQMPGRLRGNHPLCSFAAVGPLAGEIVAGQGSQAVFDPLRRLAQAGGSVVLAGVGLNVMTLLHLAEEMAGRRMFIRWARAEDGVIEVRAGGCSAGFVNLEPGLAPLAKTARLGEGVWRAFPASAALSRAALAIRRYPRITHCADPECARCNDAAAGGPDR